MKTFFCAEESYQAGEDLIGSAFNAQMYVLIECPTPWAANALDSKSVPSNLRTLIKEVDQTKLEGPVELLLIFSDQLKQEHYTRVLVFRKQKGISAGYNKQEFHVPAISDVADIVRSCLVGNALKHRCVETQTRDILVCTHGSRDKCCAKYGNPFYRKALTTVSNLSLRDVRVWQVSHFSGHRFAPTTIDFPEGRYYGRLDPVSFASILTRTGDIECLNNIYRGWAILPRFAQVLERELILMHGWDWFNYKVASQLVEPNENESFRRIELTFMKPDGSLGRYRADVVEDKSKTLYLKGDCSSTEVHNTPQFFVKSIVNAQS